MSFEKSSDAYGMFMGQYSEPLADLFLDWSGVASGQTALDVGCGPGALTSRLVDRLGAASVTAIDPSSSFVEATKRRLPGVRVELAGAENLPFSEHEFDITLAQLVVHLMPDAPAGIASMVRVTKTGGVVSACVWDHAGKRGPLATFWQAVRDLDPANEGEATLPGTAEGQLAELFADAGLSDVESGAITVSRRFADFDDWWYPFTLGVGPAGDYVARLAAPRVEALRAHASTLWPSDGFTVDALAWCARGIVA